MWLDEAQTNLPAAQNIGSEQIGGGELFAKGFGQGINPAEALMPVARLITQAEIRADRSVPGYASEEEWRLSPHYRPGITFDPKMNQDEAAMRADVFDQKAHEQWMDSHWSGFGKGVAYQAGNIVGTLLDPLMWLPAVGAAERAAWMVERLGPVAGRVVQGAVEGGAINAGLALPQAISDQRLGFDPDYSMVLKQAAIGAGAGLALGAAGAWWSSRTPQERMTVTAMALDQMSRNEPVDITPLRQAMKDDVAAMQEIGRTDSLRDLRDTMTTGELDEIMGGPSQRRMAGNQWLAENDPGVPAGVKDAPIMPHPEVMEEAPTYAAELKQLTEDPSIGARIDAELARGAEEAKLIRNRAKALAHAVGCIAREIL